MKQIFRQGDRVYSELEGWGEVDSILANTEYPIGVQFRFSHRVYTEEGKALSIHKRPELSFVEYDTEDGIYPSTERPRKSLELDTLVYVRNHESYMWEMRFFSHFDTKGNIFVFTDQRTSKHVNQSTEQFVHYSTKNPLLK